MTSFGEEPTMTAWKIHTYNGLGSLSLEEGLPLPKICKSTDVLIEVKAASLNVLDVMMAGMARTISIFENLCYQQFYLMLFIVHGYRWIRKCGIREFFRP